MPPRCYYSKEKVRSETFMNSANYCHGCIYRQRNDSSCNYIFMEGHSRGCPPGKGCTKKEVSWRRKKKIPLRINQNPKNNEVAAGKRTGGARISEEETERRLALYRAGLSDKDVAIATGVSKGTIAKWRQAKNLPANFDNAHRRINHPDCE